MDLYGHSMGRLTNKQLEKFGARRVYRYGEGDDNASLEEDFDAWREEAEAPWDDADGKHVALWAALRRHAGHAGVQEHGRRALKVVRAVDHMRGGGAGQCTVS